jgi:hypothetical protein
MAINPLPGHWIVQRVGAGREAFVQGAGEKLYQVSISAFHPAALGCELV